MSAETITLAEFKAKLSQYPALIKTYSKSAKDGQLSLEQLDHFRYLDAPSKYSKKAGGKVLEAADVRKLIDWKVKHGTFRPTLQKLVASNKDETIKSTLADAFALYSKSPSDIKTVVAKIAELKGIGPSAASLILSVHDPENVIFFADEAFRWLCHGGNKVTIKYNAKEFEDLFSKAKALSTKLKVTALDIERVAFVIMKENDPPKEPKPKKAPSGLPPGRPRIPDDQRKPKPAPSGRGRGRPVGSTTTKAAPSPGTAKRSRPSVDAKKEASSSPTATKRKATDQAPKHGKKVKTET